MTFEEVYRETYRKTVSYALRRAATPEDAHDVVSETYMVAWRRLEDFLDTRSPQAWLYRVAYRKLANKRRSNTRRAALITRIENEPVGSLPDPGRTAELRDEVRQMETALAGLSERDREVLWLIAFEDLDHGEVAFVVGTNRAMVRSILYRARARLNNALAASRQREVAGPIDSRETKPVMDVENADE